MHWSTKYNQKGSTLIEIIVALTVFSLISGSLALLFNLGLKISADDKARNTALSIAQQKMELIKNLPYSDVGLISGVPAGNISATETINYSNITYTITTNIIYIDDPFDGLLSSDTVLSTDYKKIKIKVSWPSNMNSIPVILTTNISPAHLEESDLEDTGTLSLTVYNNNLEPVTDADISIINNSLSPIINITDKTDSSGVYTLTGAPIATQSYQVIVSKTGYNSSQTYSLDPITNPSPFPFDLSVGLNTVTEQTFYIDQTSNLTINFKTLDTALAISNFSFSLHGEKSIGNLGSGQTIYKFDNDYLSDSSGQVSLSNIEYDTYHIEFDNIATGYDIAGYDQPVPIILPPNNTQIINIFLTPHTNNNVLLTMLDSNNLTVSDCTVRLYKSDLSYDVTQTSNSYGQTFFSNLDATLYNVEISKTNYQTFIQEINVANQIQQNVSLLSI